MSALRSGFAERLSRGILIGSQKFRLGNRFAWLNLKAVIHPTAIVHPGARLDATVQVGPYAIIDKDVAVGAQCIVGPQVYLTGRTTIGAHNRFYVGCVIGEEPQDLKYAGDPTGLRIGDRNVFREHVTVHRSNKVAEETVIGSECFLMAHSHVAHNCHLGDGVILANGALLAGHVTVGDRAFISGNCIAHQFVRIGTLALMQGGSAVSQDLPPYTILSQGNGICGLNAIGLRRASFTAAERLELKQLYRLLFREGLNLRMALADAQTRFTSAPAKVLMGFVSASKRGVCQDVSMAGKAPGPGLDEALAADP
jgi:UDP-N-acetylglucosamine acyltransferase